MSKKVKHKVLSLFANIGVAEAYLDDIAKKTRIQIRDVLVALTELEFEEIVECGAGNEYRIINR